MALLKSANLALAFLLELVMLAAFNYREFRAGSEVGVQLLLGIGVPIVVIIIWAIFLAPRSPRQLTGTAYTALKLVLFGLAVLALAAAGLQTPTVIFAVVVVINIVLGYVWKQA